ncbi:CapA family protein, partial [Streptomyces sp. NPDC018352]|uniref:CapA family protein n=1 Tax=Streptomyces sp. NPDC018352 TaxID=3157194 RepID=UPI0033C2B934
QPAIVPLGTGGRVLVFSFGMPSSGIPKDWAATAQRVGVDVLAEPSAAAASAFADRLRQVRQRGDIAVASVHWGPNWGYDVSRSEVRFAHALLDAGVDVVHGHSSHHPRPLEVYRDRLILYGCGDLVDDYEGIGGYQSYRDDLRVLYLVSVEADTGQLIDAQMVPLQARRMRLEHASPEDTEWLRTVLDRHSRQFGTRVDGGPDGTLKLRPLRAGQHA